ncbi:hypothetical protein CRENBAI_015154 [Crenichthys baileyi]|uniref:Olfactomedin-like domain-containing protein n=1 Tax=Crenichthys baileyi TaxID=28760 RepID=A0AAV9S4T4_9TELE
MYTLCVVVAICCAFSSRSSAAPKCRSTDPKVSDPKSELGTSAEDGLHEEMEAQEDIISKLLGDYDKVKALSEGADCRCKCVVRPLSRSACRRIEEGSATAQDFYTVETITSGPECKCACIAPPSAVNPCEGEFRLKQLREAGKENVKLSTILELLEGSFYGMDLLKLHSLTNKLLHRVEDIEKVVSQNHTVGKVEPQESPVFKMKVTEGPSSPPPHQHQDMRRVSDVGEASVYQYPEEKHEGKFTVENPPTIQMDGSGHMTGIKTLNTITSKEDSKVSKPGPKGMIIRGMTFYKSEPDSMEPDPMVADDGEPGENCRFTNSYKLPYNWIGTGHVVYGGAFYYNRAFSRDIIKYDLRQRYVSSWTMLHDAVFEESSSPWEWHSHSLIDFAVDESGLWIIYPALDDEGFLQEVVILSRLNPTDLSMQRETTWRTGLRRNNFGNCFVVCGVLYAVDSYNKRDANLEYAFDTHTNTQMIPRMPFINNYTYTTQIDYNPEEGVLYAWDNGHQVTYNIKFAYVDP